MESDYPGPSGITAGSQHMLPGNMSSPFPEEMSSSHSADPVQDSTASKIPLPMHTDPVQRTTSLSPPMTSGTGVQPVTFPESSAGVNAPWTEDDDLGIPGAPAQNPASVSSPANSPPPQGNHAASPASIAEQTNPGSPAEPHPTPVAMSPPTPDGFIASSPVGSPNYPPTPPEKPSTANFAKVDALNKQISNRTASMDAATREKETKIMNAAQEYLNALMAQRKEEVLNAKANHKEEQRVGAEKINGYKKSGALWSAVGVLVDLQKPNKYSRSTEQMRSVLSTLNTTPTTK